MAAFGLTYIPIIVRPEPPGQFTARPLGVPEIQAVGATEKEAVDRAHAALSQWKGSLHWVRVEMSDGSSVPQAAGHAKDDPDFDLYLEEISRCREEADKRECSNTSSTRTT
jgi:hypothetical protein